MNGKPCSPHKSVLEKSSCKTDTTEQLKEFFREGDFPWWQDAEQVKSDPLHRANHRLLVSAVRKIAPVSLLDVGCGCGLITMDAAEFVTGTAVGMDISGKGLPVQGSRFSVQGSKLEAQSKDSKVFYVAGDAEDIPFKDDFFDCAVCSELLEHLPSLENGLREAHRVLRNGGWLLVTVPNLFCFDSIDGSTHIIDRIFSVVNRIGKAIGVREIQQDRTHVNRMTPQGWKKIIERNGFSVIDTKPVYLVPYVPYFLKPLKKIEAYLFKHPVVESAFYAAESRLGRLFPFSVMGQLHFFMCKKVK
ncbi:MAG: class I SAM-dependent methyltransferase [bacterium]